MTDVSTASSHGIPHTRALMSDILWESAHRGSKVFYLKATTKHFLSHGKSYLSQKFVILDYSWYKRAFTLARVCPPDGLCARRIFDAAHAATRALPRQLVDSAGRLDQPAIEILHREGSSAMRFACHSALANRTPSKAERDVAKRIASLTRVIFGVERLTTVKGHIASCLRTPESLRREMICVVGGCAPPESLQKGMICAVGRCPPAESLHKVMMPPLGIPSISDELHGR